MMTSQLAVCSRMDPASHTCTKESRASPVLTPGAPARDNEITALPLFHTTVAAVAVHTAVCGHREVGWPDTSGGGAKGVALTALAEVTLLARTTCANKQVRPHGLVIERSRVRVTARAAGEMSSPGPTICGAYSGIRSTPVLPQ